MKKGVVCAVMLIPVAGWSLEHCSSSPRSPQCGPPTEASTAVLATKDPNFLIYGSTAVAKLLSTGNSGGWGLWWQVQRWIYAVADVNWRSVDQLLRCVIIPAPAAGIKKHDSTHTPFSIMSCVGIFNVSHY